jgi:hypothetical protein
MSISYILFFNFQPSDPDLATERDVFMYRAYLALQKFVIVKDEIGANSPQLIQPLKVLFIANVCIK